MNDPKKNIAKSGKPELHKAAPPKTAKPGESGKPAVKPTEKHEKK